MVSPLTNVGEVIICWERQAEARTDHHREPMQQKYTTFFWAACCLDQKDLKEYIESNPAVRLVIDV